ncbi:MAG TPA: rhodanese-like domain-containing protein, partial [Gaiellaceae bacterium]
MKAVVDSEWLAAHLGEDDLVVGDVRGPNAHMGGHIRGSRPLVLGSPPPAADEESARALAREIALRLRRHGITGRERLVLVDRGDGVGAMPAAQMAELAGHPQVAILLGGIAGWDG